jgi:hypothetical protein
MKTDLRIRKPSQTASALLLTFLMTGIALATLAGALAWSASTARLTYRSNQYTCAVAAAEAATEKVLSQITQDFVRGGNRLVNDNLINYQRMTLTASDSPYWADWEFNDSAGHIGQTFVQCASSTDYVVLNSTYAGLRGFISTCTLVADARKPKALQNVIGAVRQDVQLARIPIFQFAMYTSGDMEISCGQPFTVTGRAHSNGQLYVEPDNKLTFQSDVTAVGNILFQRSPLDTRGAPSGSVVYQGRSDSQVASLYLPIGTNNTPAAVREIIQPPPAGEDPGSPIGLERYYNIADLILVVSNSSVSASSGLFNKFATTIPTNEVSLFVSTNQSFMDWREGKTVQPVDINIGALKSWSATNSTLRPALGAKDVSSVYVVDRRTPTATTLKAVRVTNGRQLPPRGLTVATADPLYVWGHYNQPTDSYLRTADTSTTVPASLVGDAITILSVLWTDANSTADLASRKADWTTVNAAILAGAVETTQGHYGGGMENFPRFLETWGQGNAFTYNGSMVKMFPSLYATNVWGTANVYDPPKRDWSYDLNFNQSTKLPPLTPSLQKMIRSQWAAIAPNQIGIPASP